MMRATHCIECGPTVILQMLEATMAASSWPLQALKRSGISRSPQVNRGGNG
jgi:hypothetical protein